MVGWAEGGHRRALRAAVAAASGAFVLLASALSGPAAASAGAVGAGRAGFAVAAKPALPVYGLAGVRGRAGQGVSPSSGSDVLTTNSCVFLSQDQNYMCLIMGWYPSGGAIQPLAYEEGSQQVWVDDGPVADAPSGNLVNLPASVFCQDTGTSPKCAMVGSHYSTVQTAAQLAESYDGQSWQVWASASPAKTTWSGLGDVSCAGIASCMTVGAAGTSKQSSKGIVYTGHATVYSWDGGLTFTQLKPPAPKGAKTSELAGVSCWRNTACLAAGNDTSAKGKSMPYSVIWNSGAWQLKPIPRVAGQATTTVQGVACAGQGQCLAAGYSSGPGSHPFMARFSNGKWALMKLPAASAAGFTSVSCMTVTACYAVGWQGNAGLIDAWDGTTWTTQPVPATAAPFSGNVLTHVSCTVLQLITTTVCQAVGYRFNPAVPASQRTYQTLSDIKLPNTTSWQPETTPNP